MTKTQAQKNLLEFQKLRYTGKNEEKLGGFIYIQWVDEKTGDVTNNFDRAIKILNEK